MKPSCKIVGSSVIGMLVASLASAGPVSVESPLDESGFVGYVQQQDLESRMFDRWPGLKVKTLSADGGTGRLAVHAQFPAGMPARAFPAQDQSIELVMLEGQLQFGDESLATFDFAFIPPDTNIPLISSESGAAALIFFDPASEDSEAVAKQRQAGHYVVHYDESRWVQAMLARKAGATADLKVMHLKQDPETSARSWYVRLEGGMTVPWEVHSMPEEGYLMQGSYRLAECLPDRTVIGDYDTGGYFWRPGGVPHSGPESGPRSDVVMWLQRSPIALDVVFYGDCAEGAAVDAIQPSGPGD